MPPCKKIALTNLQGREKLEPSKTNKSVKPPIKYCRANTKRQMADSQNA